MHKIISPRTWKTCTAFVDVCNAVAATAAKLYTNGFSQAHALVERTGMWRVVTSVALHSRMVGPQRQMCCSVITFLSLNNDFCWQPALAVKGSMHHLQLS